MSIERALADLARLDVEVQQVRSRLTEIDEQAGRLRTYIAVAREYERDERGQRMTASPATSTPHVKVPPVGTLSRRATDTAVDLLRAKGQPMHTRDLLPQIAERGVSVGGSNPVANLSGFLSRDKARLVNSRISGWRLVEWDSKPLVVDPSKAPQATGEQDTAEIVEQASTHDDVRDAEVVGESGLFGPAPDRASNPHDMAA